MPLFVSRCIPDATWGRAGVGNIADGMAPVAARRDAVPSGLLQVNLLQMSREERMAFFINIYNALVVHAMALFGPAENTLKRYDPVVVLPGTCLLRLHECLHCMCGHKRWTGMLTQQLLQPLVDDAPHRPANHATC